jgi:hypothetical protein
MTSPAASVAAARCRRGLVNEVGILGTNILITFAKVGLAPLLLAAAARCRSVRSGRGAARCGVAASSLAARGGAGRAARSGPGVLEKHARDLLVAAGRRLGEGALAGLARSLGSEWQQRITIRHFGLWPVRTPMHERAGYDASRIDFMLMDAEAVARHILSALERKGRSSVSVNPAILLAHRLGGLSR